MSKTHDIQYHEFVGKFSASTFLISSGLWGFRLTWRSGQASGYGIESRNMAIVTARSIAEAAHRALPSRLK